LEHLTDPRAALVRARGSLSTDGLVLLEVPCAVAPHLLPPGWFTFEHLHYFSEASLLSMLRSAGLEPLELRIAFEAYIYPVIAVIARRADQSQRALADGLAVEQARRFLAEYLSRDEGFWRNSARRLCELDGSIYVWGAGVHTAQLFDRTPLLRHAKVVGIVDRDSQKWGCEQAGFKIVSPDHFFTYGAGAPVVISSFAAEEEIAVALAKAGVAQERIIRLYG
jgi:FlaA1/EpsC-like NDP-sugar epimerase